MSKRQRHEDHTGLSNKYMFLLTSHMSSIYHGGMTGEPLGHLQSSREALAAKRDFHLGMAAELDEMLRQTDRMIEVLRAEASGRSVATSPTRDTPTIREAVLDVLKDGSPHHFNNFMKALGHNGPPPKDTSVRGVVSRMKREGEIASLGQGKYEITSKGRTAVDAMEAEPSH